jgi:SAM-dependent methyltransferase
MSHSRLVNLKGAKTESFGALAAFFYRWWAEPALAPMHDRIVEEVPIVSGNLLDVGCGPGRLTRRIAERHPEVRVTGLDLSADMIRQARRGPGLPNLEFRQGSPASAGSSEEWDMALSILSFHHWEEPVEDLSAVHRALKPGGRLWIYEQDAEASNGELHADRAPLWGFLRVPGCWQRRLARGHGFTRREVEGVVRPAVAQTGFRTVRIERTGSTFRLELRKENPPSGAIDNAGDRR